MEVTGFYSKSGMQEIIKQAYDGGRGALVASLTENQVSERKVAEELGFVKIGEYKNDYVHHVNDRYTVALYVLDLKQPGKLKPPPEVKPIPVVVPPPAVAPMPLVQQPVYVAPVALQVPPAAPRPEVRNHLADYQAVMYDALKEPPNKYAWGGQKVVANLNIGLGGNNANPAPDKAPPKEDPIRPAVANIVAPAPKAVEEIPAFDENAWNAQQQQLIADNKPKRKPRAKVKKI